MVKFQPVKNGSIASYVANTIREAIFNEQLLPGEGLREMHLARDFQVSQSTVREALLQLERMGLVIRTPNRGTTVTKLSEREIQERAAVRVVLESWACIEASRLMTDEAFAELAQRLDAISDAIAANDYFKLGQADMQFHHYIWGQSGNTILDQELTQLSTPLFAFATMSLSRGRRNLKPMVHSHEMIFASLKARDPEVIRQTIREHIATSYLGSLSPGPVVESMSAAQEC